jgi:hypothetical protein
MPITDPIVLAVGLMRDAEAEALAALERLAAGNSGVSLGMASYALAAAANAMFQRNDAINQIARQLEGQS